MQLYKLDFPSGKSYIGITSKTAQERFNAHCRYGSKKMAACQHAIKKYGKENVIINVLATVDNWELLCLAEQEAIEKFNTFSPNGYNLTLGGDGTVSINIQDMDRIEYDRNKKRDYAKKNADKIKERLHYWHKDNKERLNTISRQYHKDNKEALSIKKDIYRESNKEKIIDKGKKYYEENKEKIKEKSKKYREENKEKLKKKAREYNETNKERLSAKSKEYYEKNKESILEKARIFASNNREMLAEKQRKYREIKKEFDK